MNELVIMKDQQAVTTSLQVAEVFGKRHDNILRDIENLKKDILNFEEMFSEGTEPDSYGRDRRTYFMNRDGFTLLAMGFTGKKALGFKLKYIEAFNRMEKAIKEERIQLPKTPMEALKLMFEATEETNKKVDRIDSDVDYLKNNQRLDPTEYAYISKRISRKVYEYIDMHGLALSAPQRSKLYKDINRGINEVTGVKTRSQLRQKDFDKADEFISNWQPSTATVQIIKEMSKVPAGQTTLGD
ncbi:Rha family transcriptional regulator [Pediococcus acidilactici]|uniref:Rha family transcriptional regulator n=2 Tax=Pediococcus acidilactici TaxID=1254 RepID=UPI00132452BF|nr:Rha family transcriptional regulator [Pediococcus acidilactici]KAF0339748.1 phage regulatory protein [Pediococcus acidilactici]KAF0379710.1 phage regulatory protein [Pediococcus acidilactici]KAF0452951.1 phage regulatory protein [Pediococcus acidilactici]KAF0462230.1 phage regulatory protein [Pediococcus acidilactici]KAF0485447.1 phage regulatory protein [Pediococcus acidilactici]